MRSRLAATNLYYGWVVTGACFLAAGTLFGLTYSFSVFFDALAATFPVSPARISLVFGVQTATLYLGGAVLGRLLDRFGPRALLGVGTLLLPGGLLLAARADSILAFTLAYGVVTGAGMSCCYVVAYATIPSWFGRRRGFANGVAAAGLGAGLVAVVPVASRLTQTAGWRQAFTLLALALGVALLLATVVLARPADVDADRSYEFPDGVPGGESDEGPPARETILSLPFALVVLGWAGVYATLYVLINHLVPYADGLGVRWAGVTGISALGFATALARLAIGYGSDRIGRIRVFVACSTLMGLCLLALPLARGPVGIIAVAVVFGVGYGGNGALLSPLVADLFGVANIGTLHGVASTAFALAGLTAPPLATTVAAANGYTLVFLVTGIAGLAGATCILLAGRTAPRPTA
ncbi:MAG: MFS transporter [Halobacteriales archaeon]|nr:MFS transporter [Halobacteriales archaeon]